MGAKNFLSIIQHFIYISRFIYITCSLYMLYFFIWSSYAVFHALPPGEEDRGWRVWGDLRGIGPADAGQCGAEGGVGPAAKAGAQDGGRRAQEAPGWVEMDSVASVTFLELIDPPCRGDLLSWPKTGYPVYSWQKNKCFRELKHVLPVISPEIMRTKTGKEADQSRKYHASRKCRDCLCASIAGWNYFSLWDQI